MKVRLIHTNKRRGVDTIALCVDFEYIKNEPEIQKDALFNCEHILLKAKIDSGF